MLRGLQWRAARRSAHCLPSERLWPREASLTAVSAYFAEPPPSLALLLSLADLAELILSHLHDLADLAAVGSACLPVGSALRELILLRACQLLASPAMRSGWDARFDFLRDVCGVKCSSASRQPITPGVASLLAKPECKVTGARTCRHGLCQKQDVARPGVVSLLDRLVEIEDSDVANSRSKGGSVSVLALECAARLHGALGRTECALRYWNHAACKGSPRALLDMGKRYYRTSDSFAGEMLRNAVAAAEQTRSQLTKHGSDERSAEAVLAELEALQIQALAELHLGYISVDGEQQVHHDIHPSHSARLAHLLHS
ncbi:MAG: hypothetical protein SGPRY_000627 [Prymnesium sp.]